MILRTALPNNWHVNDYHGDTNPAINIQSIIVAQITPDWCEDSDKRGVPWIVFSLRGDKNSVCALEHAVAEEWWQSQLKSRLQASLVANERKGCQRTALYKVLPTWMTVSRQWKSYEWRNRTSPGFFPLGRIYESQTFPIATHWAALTSMHTWRRSEFIWKRIIGWQIRFSMQPWQNSFSPQLDWNRYSDYGLYGTWRNQSHPF